MAQGQFTKEEAGETRKAVEEMFDALPKSKKSEYFGHLNDILLFIEAAKKQAPDETKEQQTNATQSKQPLSRVHSVNSG